VEVPGGLPGLLSDGGRRNSINLNAIVVSSELVAFLLGARCEITSRGCEMFIALARGRYSIR
jgi:hypothetical protein